MPIIGHFVLPNDEDGGMSNFCVGHPDAAGCGTSPSTAQTAGDMFTNDRFKEFPIRNAGHFRSSSPLMSKRSGTRAEFGRACGGLAGGVLCKRRCPAERTLPRPYCPPWPLTRSAIWIAVFKEGARRTNNAMRFAVRSGVAVRSSSELWNRSPSTGPRIDATSTRTPKTKPFSTDNETKSKSR